MLYGTFVHQVLFDPASSVSRSCLSCVTILPQLCHDPTSVVSRSYHVCDKIVPRMRAASHFLLDIHQLSNIFLKNNRENIWRVLKKSIPLHSLFGNTPASNIKKEFFERIYINREVVQEASASVQ